MARRLDNSLPDTPATHWPSGIAGWLFSFIGNPLNDGTWTYTWENGRQLARMQSVDTDASFVYNENGLRVQKTVNGVVTNYTLHGKNVVHMTVGGNELHFFYDAQNKPAVVVYNGIPYSYAKNLQGDIVAILNSAGTSVVNYVYDAWGRPISKTGTLASTLGTVQPFRYRGYVYDEETGLYYLRSRYYSTRVDRFINSDARLNGNGGNRLLNVFAYCDNRPIIHRDMDGYECEDCDGYWFVHSYTISGDAYQAFLEWEYERFPVEDVNPPIVDTMAEAGGIVSEMLFGAFDNYITKGKSILDNFLNLVNPCYYYDQRIEARAVDCLARITSRARNYSVVRVDLLFGSHVNEMQLTFMDESGKVIYRDAFDIRSDNVIFAMMDYMGIIVDTEGGAYEHQDAEWGFSFID